VKKNGKPIGTANGNHVKRHEATSEGKNGIEPQRGGDGLSKRECGKKKVGSEFSGFIKKSVFWQRELFCVRSRGRELRESTKNFRRSDLQGKKEDGRRWRRAMASYDD